MPKTLGSTSEHELESDLWVTEAEDFDFSSELTEDEGSGPGMSTVIGEDGEALERVSSAEDPEESWGAFFLSVLFANSKSPAINNTVLTLLFLTTLYGASPGWYGPQVTLEDIYDIDNGFFKNYSDACCVELNTLSRFFYLIQTLKLFDKAYKGVESLGWLDLLMLPMVASVTAGDTILAQKGKAAQIWAKPHIYSAIGISAIELWFLDFRNVSSMYKSFFCKFFYPNEAKLLEHIAAIKLHLYTLSPEKRLQEFKKTFGIPDQLTSEGQISNYLKDEANKKEVASKLKESCERLGLISTSKVLTAISIGSVFYTLVGGVIASYGWINFLKADNSPDWITGLTGSFCVAVKTCGYTIAFSMLMDLIVNCKLLLNGVRQTGSQSNWYFLAVGAVILGFIATVPLSGLTFFQPTQELLNHFFPEWVQKGDVSYQIILPLLGAMGSIANSIGYIGMCKILLDRLRQSIDEKILGDTVDARKILDKLEAEIVRKVEPDRQSIVFLVNVLYFLFRTPGNTTDYADNPAYSDSYHFITNSTHYIPAIPEAPLSLRAVAYAPQKTSNFFSRPKPEPKLTSSAYGTFSAPTCSSSSR